ncbi:hypothetical protein FRX31_018546 [Thalictrum thalictroides]|uniref:Uncharacterized protein n=1 Tax=Thalictrum thalictroides TaxID=46969 RepID=A0A7J6W3B1_THATH|nr:hypothetical protein FRX31_018546 [Thalictrum thalictroides]
MGTSRSRTARRYTRPINELYHNLWGGELLRPLAKAEPLLIWLVVVVLKISLCRRGFCFSKWSKEAGALSSEEIKDMGKDLTIQVKGIPLHLRIQSVMEEIAKACGHSWKVNDDSLDLVGGIPSISLANCDISKISRILYVVESGHRFPVVIGIVDIDKYKQEGERKETLVR